MYTAADRGFQRFYKAVEPVGDVKPDWEIISLMSTAMGYPMHYNNTKEIWDELRELCPIYYGATYEKWRTWLISSGRAAMWRTAIRVQNTCTTAVSLILRTAKVSSIPVNGVRRSTSQ